MLLPRVDQETQPLVVFARTWLFPICTKEEHGGAREWSAVRWGLACLGIWGLARVHTLGAGAWAGGALGPPPREGQTQTQQAEVTTLVGPAVRGQR